MTLKTSIFILHVITNLILLSGGIWSITYPKKRIWPPPRKQSWQYYMTWSLFYTAFLANAVLIILDWNTWIMSGWVRILGVALAITGGTIVSSGIYCLSIKNTYGLKNGFISHGVYRYTRNPQYVGDTLLFMGISLFLNSLFVLIVHALLSTVLLLAPFMEEPWLEGVYGDEYINYKKRVPRFFKR